MGVVSTKHSAIRQAVLELEHYTIPAHLRALGFGIRQVRAAVAAGVLRWTRDGSLEVA